MDADIDNGVRLAYLKERRRLLEEIKEHYKETGRYRVSDSHWMVAELENWYALAAKQLKEQMMRGEVADRGSD